MRLFAQVSSNALKIDAESVFDGLLISFKRQRSRVRSCSGARRVYRGYRSVSATAAGIGGVVSLLPGESKSMIGVEAVVNGEAGLAVGRATGTGAS